jgi:outer membrane protein assembly factor BamB
MIADGVVLYTAGHKRPLRGFDLKTGKPLWDMVDVGTAAGRSPGALGHKIPLRWTRQGKEYGTAGGTCFEPRTGKVLWQVDGRSVGRNGGSAALSEHHIVFGSSAHGGITCYRITPEKAELAWALPKELKTETASLCIHQGHVYAIRVRNGKGLMAVLAIGLETGKIIANEEIGGTAGERRPDKGCDGCSSVFAFGDRFCYRAANKATQGTIVVWDAAPGKVALREFFQPVSYASAATPAVAMGRLFLRGEGHVLCYDLRKQ